MNTEDIDQTEWTESEIAKDRQKRLAQKIKEDNSVVSTTMRKQTLTAIKLINLIESISVAKVEYFEYTDSVSTDILKAAMLKTLTEAPEAPDLTYITKVA